MTDSKEIADGIRKLYFSRVKADMAALARLEKAVGAPAYRIVDELDDADFLNKALTDPQPERPPASRVGRLVSSGMLGASAAGLVFLAVKPANTPAAMSIGFVAGMSLSLKHQEEEE